MVLSQETIEILMENLKVYIVIDERGLVNTPLWLDIKENGIKEPILVKSLGKGKYLIVDGYHRYYIAKKLGLKSMLCTVVIIPEDYNWRNG